MNKLVDINVYKEAVYYADNILSMSKRLGWKETNDEQAVVESSYQLLVNNPSALKKSKRNRISYEKQMAREDRIQDRES